MVGDALHLRFCSEEVSEINEAAVLVTVKTLRFFPSLSISSVSDTHTHLSPSHLSHTLSSLYPRHASLSLASLSSLSRSEEVSGMNEAAVLATVKTRPCAIGV